MYADSGRTKDGLRIRERMTNQDDAGQGLTVVVIAGAVARGAYEAAALTQLLPLIGPDLRSTILLGTSAGAINAALWAQAATPGRPLADVGRAVEDVWLGIDRQAVFAFSARDALESRLHGQSPHALLDTTPLEETAKRLMRPNDIAANVSAGSVAGVGAVATLCPQDGSGGRSRLFFHSPRTPPTPAPGGSIDFAPTPLLPEHVLASSAVPVLFPAMKVQHPESAAGWYIDGGVRLNTPIKPAIDLGATRLVIVSSYATTYPLAPATRIERPTVPDTAAQSIHAVLGDGMIEDLRRLHRTNELVQQAPIKDTDGRPYRRIPFMVVAPANGTLSKIARETYDSRPRSFPTFGLDFYSTIDWLLPGTNLGNNELLSYLYFDARYFNAQFECGRKDAQAAVDAGWQY